MQLNDNDYAWMTGGKPSSPVFKRLLLVCVAGEAWECYKKLNCFRCHGENHCRVWWTFHCQFKTSNDPTVADSPDAIYSIQGCCFSVYFGEGLNGAIVQRLMLDRGKCYIINTLSSNIAMFVWRLLPDIDNIATRVVVSETESCMKCLICLFGDEVRLYFIVFRPACSASRFDRASFHRLKKAWRQLDMTCKWNKARPNWPKSTVSFMRHCGQSARHGGKLPRCRRQIRGLISCIN